ncbi:MAG: PIN domain-containing protein [Xanthomonadales bacterium]|nr:PIN domain-containing protein [Xanthomonadales bacterium]
MNDYRAFFAQRDLVRVELTPTVVELATAIRARHGLKTPDALQAACCLQLGLEHVFTTGDAAFVKVAGVKVRLVR